MKHLYTHIMESIDTLYHFTNGGNMVNILKNDEFIASDEGHGKFISTTRTPYAKIGYPTGMIAKDIVRIVLDGKKLATKYKIKPYSWGASKGNIHDPQQTNVESEERIYLKQTAIPNFHKYIKKIQINTNTIDAGDADDIIRLSERMNIEVEVAESDKEFDFMK